MEMILLRVMNYLACDGHQTQMRPAYPVGASPMTVSSKLPETARQRPIGSLRQRDHRSNSAASPREGRHLPECLPELQSGVPDFNGQLLHSQKELPVAGLPVADEPPLRKDSQKPIAPRLPMPARCLTGRCSVHREAYGPESSGDAWIRSVCSSRISSAIRRSL